MNNCWRAKITTILLLVIFATACSKAPEKTKDLKLGYLLNMTHAVPIVGIETQAFSDVKAQHFLTGTNVVDALITGNVDLAYFGPGPWINAVSKDRSSAT